MTLTVEFSAPRFSFLPWIDILWNKDKAIACGWGPLQIFFTNFSPIAAGNYWRTVCKAIVHDNEAMNRLNDLSQGKIIAEHELAEKVRKVMS